MDVCDIRLHNGAPTLHINGEPVFAPMLTTNKNPHNTGNKDWRPDPYFEDFYRAGFRLFQIAVEGDIGGFDRCYDPETDSFPSEGYDYSCEVLAEYARRCPGIKVLLRIMPEPRGKNSKWLQMHPEQMELMEEKWQSHNYENPSYASDLWLNDACRYIKRFGEELIARGLGDNVLGFLIGGGNSCDVHATIIYGQDAFGMVKLGGKGKPNIQIIVKEPGSSGALDPLNQRGTIAWKVPHFACAVLQDDFIVRLEHGVSA